MSEKITFNNNRPLILVTNDDGITAPGIRLLIRLMNEIGNVLVVAPNNPQSGKGHAITVDSIMYRNRVKIDIGPQIEYDFSGTPADCVKFAKTVLLERKPDICVSGINHGLNAAINVIYSGTMSAAVEAGIDGIPAIGFSYDSFSWDTDFSHIGEMVQSLVKGVLKNGIDQGTVLNVNFPNLKKDEYKGIKVCHQGKSVWTEHFEKRTTPMGKEYYWLSGDFKSFSDGKNSDIETLRLGYVTVTPVHFDMTNYAQIPILKNWIEKT